VSQLNNGFQSMKNGSVIDQKVDSSDRNGEEQKNRMKIQTCEMSCDKLLSPAKEKAKV